MISLEDCIGMCGLTEEEVLAIAEHEHLSEVSAAALADYLLHLPKGANVIKEMMRDDIRQAIRTGNTQHARQLIAAMHHFLQEHPDAA